MDATELMLKCSETRKVNTHGHRPSRQTGRSTTRLRPAPLGRTLDRNQILHVSRRETRNMPIGLLRQFGRENINTLNRRWYREEL
jgi:hypothetical protein